MRSAALPPVIAVVQRKGGTGKTTVALALAGELSRRCYRVAVVDSDSQRSAGQWGELGRLPFEVRELPFDANKSRLWAHDLTAISSELIVLDTPSSEQAVAAAMTVAAVAVMPCTPSGLDVEATEQALKIVRAVRARRGDSAGIVIVPNRVDARTLEGRQLQETLNRFGESVASPISARAAFVRAFFAGETLQDYAPNTVADREVRKLTNRVLELLWSRGTQSPVSRVANAQFAS
jgi:chromosome partitioning protein